MVTPSPGREPAQLEAAERTRRQAAQLRICATIAGCYAAVALPAALIQSDTAADTWVGSSGPEPGAVTWLAWWVLTGLPAFVAALVCLAGSLVLGRLADVTAPAPVTPTADHYR